MERALFVRGTVTSLLRFRGEEMGYKVIQRGLDIVVSLVVLILGFPLFLFIAIAVKKDSPGPIFSRHFPVFFKHSRVGINRRRQNRENAQDSERRVKDLFGKLFTFYKFRTMYVDAQERFPELYAYDYTEEEFKTLTVQNPDDHRITRVGRLLRRTSLDELPNFINVLKGDMHLVGPRPDIWENIRYYPKHHLKKFSIKPGITCLAQIRGRGKLTFLETNELDIEYMRNRSLALDLKILFKTILVTFKSVGAF